MSAARHPFLVNAFLLFVSVIAGGCSHGPSDASTHASGPESLGSTSAADSVGRTNWALHMPATQSSAYGGDPSRAVDGNTDGNYWDNAVTHTGYDLYAWWQVDLGTTRPVGDVDIWNRTDCCGNRLSAFYVFAKETPFVGSTPADLTQEPGVTSQFVPGNAQYPTTVTIGHSARYVRVQLSGQNYLSLAEVMVWSPGLPQQAINAASAAIVPDPANAAATINPPLGSAALSVSDRGDAQYRVPIWVPPGRAGIQPALSLDYTSSGSNGTVGMGWQLSGLPRIVRCRNPPAAGTPPAQLHFDSSDSYCLDGEVLVAVSPSEYHKFHDDYSRIMPSGFDALGPLGFQQDMKDGRVFVYGLRDEFTRTVRTGQPAGPEKPENVTSTTVGLSWVLTEVFDRADNSMTVLYARPPAPAGTNYPGQLPLEPVEIDYTRNLATAPPVLAQRSVKLYYDTDRPDGNVAYVSGVGLTSVARLTRLEMYAPNPTIPSLIRTLSLSYQPSPSTGKSLLKTVQECDGPAPADPTTAAVLCRHEDFSYQSGSDPTNGWTDVDTGITDVRTGDGTPLTVIDVNGDGRSDLLYQTQPTDGSSVYKLILSTGMDFAPTTSFIALASSGPPYLILPSAGEPQVADFNGDGHMDLLYRGYIYLATNDPALGWTLLPCTSQSCPSLNIAPLLQSKDSSIRVMDVDGDRWPDLITWVESYPAGFLGYALNKHGSFPSTSTAFLATPKGLSVAYADLAGSGNASSVALQWRAVIPDITPTSFSCNYPTPTPNSAVDLEVDDMNGVSYSNLRMFHCAAGNVVQPGGTYGLVEDNFVPSSFADYNGDGLSDVIVEGVHVDVRASTATTAKCTPSYAGALRLNTGSGFESTISIDPSVPQSRQPFGYSGLLVSDDCQNAVSWPSLELNHSLPRLSVDLHESRAPVFLDWTTVATDGPTPLAWGLAWGANGPYLTPAAMPNLYPKPPPQTCSNGVCGGAWEQDFNQLAILDVNGDGLQDFANVRIDADGKPHLHLMIRQGQEPDLLATATGRFGPASQVNYQPLADAQDGCVAPVRCVNAGKWVAHVLSIDNGVGSVNSYTHTFFHGQVDTAGGRFIGFQEHDISDPQTATTITRKFDLSPNAQGPTTFYPLAESPYEEDSVTTVPSYGIRTSKRHTNYMVRGTGPYDVVPTDVTQNTTDEIGDQFPVVRQGTESYSFDVHGNMTSRSYSQCATCPGIETETYTYENDPIAWRVANVLMFTERSAIDNSDTGEAQTRTTAYEYDQNGLLFRRTQDPGAPNGQGGYKPLEPQPDGVKTLYTEIHRDGTGLPTQIVSTDRNDGTGVRRERMVVYDRAENLFPVAISNPGGYWTQSVYQPALGVVAAQVDENSLTTTMQYDAWGRLVAEQRPAGDSSQLSYPITGYAYGAVVDTEFGGNSPGAVTASVLDSLGREVQRLVNYRQDGRVVVVATAYDNVGRVASVSRPFFQGDTGAATQTTYDNLGRPTVVTHPDHSSTTFSYFGPRSTTTDANAHTQTVTRDVWKGRPVSSFQSFDGNIVLGTGIVYGPFDAVQDVGENSLNVTSDVRFGRTTVYDRRGRPRLLLDVDSTPRKFIYNAFGERTADIRGGQVTGSASTNKLTWDVTGGTGTAITYDLDGRVTQVAAPDVIQNTIWDTAANGIGKVAAATIMYDVPLGSQTDPNSSNVVYTYDSLSRLSSKQWQQPSLPPVTVGYGYDAFNRLSLVQYPGVNGQPTLVTQNVYSPGGQLTAVTWPEMGTKFWQLLSSDASDTFQTVRFGNGVVSTATEDSSHPGWLSTITSTERLGPVQALTYHWDGHHRLRGRDDAVNGTKETFNYYPGADLLQSWSWTNGTVNRSTTYTYDHLGNLVQRTDGNGTFAPTFNPHPVLGGPWLGPHQPDSDGQGNQYTYDDHGNQTAAAGRRAVFNQLDMLMEVINPDGTNYTFEYDGELHRTQRMDPWGGITDTFGGLFDVYTRYDGTFGHVWHIFAGGRPVAQIETKEVNWAVQSSQTTYLLLDQLGSVDTLTDGEGVGYNPTKFAPFGTRVQPSDPALPVMAPPWDVRQGFAGHVDDDDLGLVDMVGRVYDPAQQRFLTQDRMGPDALLPTSFNPYAYVRNNPLNATDPTGWVGVDDPGDPGDPGGDPLPAPDPLPGGPGFGRGSGPTSGGSTGGGRGGVVVTVVHAGVGSEVPYNQSTASVVGPSSLFGTSGVGQGGEATGGPSCQAGIGACTTSTVGNGSWKSWSADHFLGLSPSDTIHGFPSIERAVDWARVEAPGCFGDVCPSPKPWRTGQWTPLNDGLVERWISIAEWWAKGDVHDSFVRAVEMRRQYPYDTNLAAAAHYLQAREDKINIPLPGFIFAIVDGVVYEAPKALFGRGREVFAKDSDPTSPGSWGDYTWMLRGITDGQRLFWEPRIRW
jgi:RHS repeat-associated protein